MSLWHAIKTNKKVTEKYSISQKTKSAREFVSVADCLYVSLSLVLMMNFLQCFLFSWVIILLLFFVPFTHAQVNDAELVQDNAKGKF